MQTVLFLGKAQFFVLSYQRTVCFFYSDSFKEESFSCDQFSTDAHF